MTLPKAMRALCLVEDGFATDPQNALANPKTGDFLVEKIYGVPTLKSGQILVKMVQVCVNPSDIMFIHGLYGQPRKIGTPAGFEGVGTVVSGKGFMAKRLIGKRVAFVSAPNGSGTWAEYAVTDAVVAIPLRNAISDADGAAMVVNPLTAIAMVNNVPKGGAFVVNAAASQLGKLMAVHAAKTGKRMVAVVRRDAPIDALKALGCVGVLNETSSGFRGDFRDIVASEKPRVLLDAVAGPSSSKLFNAMPKRARWVVYGKLSPDSMSMMEPGKLIFMHQKIEGFWLVNWLQRASTLKKLVSIRQVQFYFESGVWKTDISATLLFNEALTGMDKALKIPDGKVMISFEN